MRNFSIDGVSAETYGVFLVRNSYKDIFTFPSVKNREVTDWPDEDGVEVSELPEPLPDAKTFSMTFAFRNIGRAAEFFALMRTPSAHRFVFDAGNAERNLRVTSVGITDLIKTNGVVTISFVEDEPVVAYEAEPVGDARVKSQGYVLDGVDLSAYGCIVTDGTEQGLKSLESMKNPEVVSNSVIPGQKVLSYDSHRNSRKVTLYLTMLAPGDADFAANWKSLCSALFASHKHVLEAFGKEWGFYVESCVADFFDVVGNGGHWLDFRLNICLTNED